MNKFPDTYVIASFDTMEILKSAGDVDAQFSPCSTFKLPIAIMGFDSGVLVDDANPVWDYDPAYDPHSIVMLDQWKKPHTPALWMQQSCVWYSQQVTQRLGRDKFQRYVDGFGYGNRDVSGCSGKDNMLLRSWITSSLAISPLEQIGFIRRMLASELPVAEDAVQRASALVAAGDFMGGKLFGKTGSGYLDISAGRQRGWYAGWLDRKDGRLLFACLLDHEGAGFAGWRARTFIQERLQNLG